MYKIISLTLLLLCCQIVPAQETNPAPSPTPAVSAKTALREPALALLAKALREMRETRMTRQRFSNQLKLAALLWPYDEKQARTLFTETTNNWQPLLEQIVAGSKESPDEGGSRISEMLRLRYEVAETWGSYDGNGTLRFLRATRAAAENYASENPQFAEAEAQMELQVAQQLLRHDPKLALKTMQDSIAKGDINSSHIAFLNELKATDAAAANDLAHTIYGHIDAESVGKSQNGGYVAFQFLQYAHEALTAKGKIADPPVSEAEIRSLTAILVKFSLSITPDQIALNNYKPEYSNVQNTLNFLSSWPELEKYAPGRPAEVKARVDEWQKLFRRGNEMQEYYEAVQTQPIEAAVEKVAGAPAPYRNMLYQQLANRAVAAGNNDQARQLINDHVTNPAERTAALANIDRMLLQKTLEQDNLEASRAGIAQVTSRIERFELLTQLAQQALTKGKKDEARKILEEARQQLPSRPATQDQAGSFFTLATMYSEIAPARAFEIIEPLIDQFNDLCTNAERVDGFIGQTYDEGEFLLEGSLGNFAQQFPNALAALAEKDFARTEKTMSRLQRREVRIITAVAIAQNILQPEEKASGNEGATMSRPVAVRPGIIID